MRHMRTEVVPEHTKQVLDRTTCDLCGQEIPVSVYSVDEVKMARSRGEVYPDGGYGDTQTFDICGTCFENKLVPWMREHGAKPRIEKWDY